MSIIKIIFFIENKIKVREREKYFDRLVEFKEFFWGKKSFVKYPPPSYKVKS